MAGAADEQQAAAAVEARQLRAGLVQVGHQPDRPLASQRLQQAHLFGADHPGLVAGGDGGQLAAPGRCGQRLQSAVSAQRGFAGFAQVVEIDGIENALGAREMRRDERHPVFGEVVAADDHRAIVRAGANRLPERLRRAGRRQDADAEVAQGGEVGAVLHAALGQEIDAVAAFADQLEDLEGAQRSGIPVGARQHGIDDEDAGSVGLRGLDGRSAVGSEARAACGRARALRSGQLAPECRPALRGGADPGAVRQCGQSLPAEPEQGQGVVGTHGWDCVRRLHGGGTEVPRR